MKRILKKRKREITLIIVTMMVLILFFVKDSQGKGFSITNVHVSGDIAKPIFEIENSECLKITNLQNKGIYNFKIKNYNKTGEITQVEMEYYIEILGNETNNILLKLKKENEEIKMIDNKTKKFLLNKDNKEEHKYSLEIIYDTTKNIEELSQKIEIKVSASQIENKIKI